MNIRIKSILSNGLVFGPIKKIEYQIDDNTRLDKMEELQRLDLAIKKTLDEVESLKTTDEGLKDYLLSIELMLKDKVLYNMCVNHINEGVSARESINISMRHFIDMLAQSGSSYLSERANDLEDVSKRLIYNLYEHKDDTLREKSILFMDKVYPTVLINNLDMVTAIIAHKSGFTSHAAILCRSKDIPFVLVDDDVDFRHVKYVIIDTRKRIVIANPNFFEYEEALSEIKKKNKYVKRAVLHEGYSFLANVTSNNDLKRVLEYNFDGIGLYRTELIFMNLDRPYTKEEQVSIYKPVVEALGPNRDVCFRTFDIGDDKKLSYLNVFEKGVDNYFKNPTIFKDQVEAILEVNYMNTVKLMFPMIKNVHEFRVLKDWVLRICEAGGYNVPRIGMMLETVSALDSMYEFTDVDFVSVGTNDLMKELYGIDRMHDSYSDEHIWDLLSRLRDVVNHCEYHHIPLSVCGELASVKDVAVEFFKIGIKELSVSPAMIQHLNTAFIEFKE